MSETKQSIIEKALRMRSIIKKGIQCGATDRRILQHEYFQEGYRNDDVSIVRQLRTMTRVRPRMKERTARL